MRKKRASDAMKRHQKILHLARHHPEDWERENKASLTESLREARARARAAEKEVEENKKMLRHNEQQVRLRPIRQHEL